MKVVEREQINLSLDAFYFAVNAMMNRANRVVYGLDWQWPDFGIAMLPFEIYRKMEDVQNAPARS